MNITKATVKRLLEQTPLSAEEAAHTADRIEKTESVTELSDIYWQLRRKQGVKHAQTKQQGIPDTK